MCGLTAVVDQQMGVTERLLRVANESIRHRGPDEEGIWINRTRTCGLGHVRLSVMDPHGGQQPLSSPDGSIRAIVNGEFYGFEAIRDDFAKRGYTFRSNSDSEILIPLYLNYGERCFEHLRGEFAFVLWDEREQLLFLARDRFGIKPLFYAHRRDAFYASSEIKALLAMGVPARWDTEAVFADETALRNCTDTLFRDVKCVPPGHFMLVRGKRVSTRRYWDFDYPDRKNLRSTCSEQAYADQFWSLLSETVRLRLRSDVPVGMYLSGGVDSSSILALMREHAPGPLDVFTLSFSQAAFDESAIAREMAAYVGVKQTVVDVDTSVLASNFEETIWHTECPFSNGNAIAKYVLSRHLQDAGFKVVLTGEGADEVLAGYWWYLRDMRLHNSRAIGPMVAKQITLLKRAKNKLLGLAPKDQPAQFPSVREMFGFVPAQLSSLYGAACTYAQLRCPEFINHVDQRDRFAALTRSLDPSQIANRDPLNKSLYLTSKTSLPNHILTNLGDRVEMGHSIEARLPFLDHKLVEFLTRLPVGLKIKVRFRGGTEKYLLRRAARGHVTDTIYRRSKHAFRVPPITSGPADPLAEVVSDTLHGSEMRDLGLYDQAKVLEFYETSSARNPGQVGGLVLHIAGLAIMQRRFGLSLA